jgi:ribonuclease P protein component
VTALGGAKFQKSKRLLDNEEFRRVFRSGKRLNSSFLTLIFRFFQPKLGVIGPKLGLSVSKKVGNAVIRNKIKRRIREIFRKNQLSIAKNVEIVLIPRSEAASVGYQELEKSMLGLLSRANVFNSGEKS